MNKLTIGIFLEHYEPFVSGVITSVNGLVAELENRGHKVYIICPKVKGYIDTNPQIIRIPSIPSRTFDNTTIGFPTPGVLRRLGKIKFDVIHSHDIFYTAGVGLLVARKQKIPYIQTYHTLWHRFIEQYPLGLGFKMGTAIAAAASYPVFFGLKTTADFLKYYSAIEHSPDRLGSLAWGHMVNMSRQASTVVVPSKHLQEDLINKGLSAEIIQIPNGVMPVNINIDDILPARKPGVQRIISVARFSDEKRLDTLIHSLAKLKNNTELIMAGAGPKMSFIENLVIEKKLTNRVRFMGNLSNGAVRKLMLECDALALASYNFDNQPMVILEAIEAGLPIVYCDPRLQEGLSAANSILVANNPKGFAEAFIRLNDAKLSHDMSAASHTLSKQFQMSVVAGQVLGVYERSIRANLAVASNANN